MSGAKRKVVHCGVPDGVAACGAWLGQKSKKTLDPLKVTCAACLTPREKHGSTRHPDVDWDAEPLGEVPDRVLAERLGVGLTTVWRQRQKRGIKPFRKRVP